MSNCEPYKFDDIKKAEYIKLISSGVRRGIAAKAVGVTRQTISVHMQNDAEFKKTVSEAELDADEPVENALYESAKSGNVVAIQVWLYNRQPEAWADKRKVQTEISGPNGGPIEMSLSMEEKLKKIEALRNANK